VTRHSTSFPILTRDEIIKGILVKKFTARGVGEGYKRDKQILEHSPIYRNAGKLRQYFLHFLTAYAIEPYTSLHIIEV